MSRLRKLANQDSPGTTKKSRFSPTCASPTVFFLPVDPMDKNHKDPDTIDLEPPRLAQ